MTRLLSISCTGAGRYYARCRVCFRCTPEWVQSDELKLLALAQSAGWLVSPARGTDPTAKHELLCPACVGTSEAET